MVQWHPFEAVGLMESVPFWEQVLYRDPKNLKEKTKTDESSAMLTRRQSRV